MLLPELLPGRGHCLAVAAPGRKELDKGVLAPAQDNVVKRVGRDLDSAAGLGDGHKGGNCSRRHKPWGEI